MRIIVSTLCLLLTLGASHLHAQAGAAHRHASGQAGLLGISTVTLKPGVEGGTLERFFAEHFLPEASRFYPGVRVLLVKGDRGPKSGDYLYILSFETAALRDLYFPAPGQPSEAFHAIARAMGGMDRLRNLYARFGELATMGETSDFRAIP